MPKPHITLKRAIILVIRGFGTFLRAKTTCTWGLIALLPVLNMGCPTVFADIAEVIYTVADHVGQKNKEVISERKKYLKKL